MSNLTNERFAHILVTFQKGMKAEREAVTELFRLMDDYFPRVLGPNAPMKRDYDRMKIVYKMAQGEKCIQEVSDYRRTHGENPV